MTIQEIIEQTAAKYNLTVAEITGERRDRKIVYPRHEVMYRAYRETGASLPMIGKAMNRDHTSVLHGVRGHEKRMGLGEVNGAAES